MALRSCLDERPAPVVADTSVVINLNATGCSEAILGALPNRCVVPKEVSLEPRVGRRTGREDADALAALSEQQLVEHAQLIVDTRNATRSVKKGQEKIIKI